MNKKRYKNSKIKCLLRWSHVHVDAIAENTYEVDHRKRWLGESNKSTSLSQEIGYGCVPDDYIISFALNFMLTSTVRFLFGHDRTNALSIDTMFPRLVTTKPETLNETLLLHINLHWLWTIELSDWARRKFDQKETVLFVRKQHLKKRRGQRTWKTTHTWIDQTIITNSIYHLKWNVHLWLPRAHL